MPFASDISREYAAAPRGAAQRPSVASRNTSPPLPPGFTNLSLLTLLGIKDLSEIRRRAEIKASVFDTNAPNFRPILGLGSVELKFVAIK